MNLRNTIFAATTASLTALLLTSGIAVATEVTIKGASCFPIGSPPSLAYEHFVDDVNAMGKGILQINNVGGAPAIGSPFTLTQKMSRGAYDIIGCPETFFGNVISEAPVLRLTAWPYAKLRENGGLDYMQKLFHAKNLHYIARHADFGPFNLWLNKKIENTDLTGLNLRVAPNYTAFFKSMGSTVQNSTLPQIYTLMENNTVQGFGWPAGAFVPPWAKVTKYQVKPGFYTASAHILMNKKKWDSLGAEQQALLNKIGLEYEAKNEPGNSYLAGVLEKGEAMRKKAGMEIIEFKGAEAEKWVNAANKAGWDEVIERSPENGKALEKLFRK